MMFVIVGLVLAAAGAYLLVSGGIFAIASYTLLPLGIIFTLVGLFLRRSSDARNKLIQMAPRALH